MKSAARDGESDGPEAADSDVPAGSAVPPPGAGSSAGWAAAVGATVLMLGTVGQPTDRVPSGFRGLTWLL
jgi:hypothetical protein